jgi:hypothetical protein
MRITLVRILLLRFNGTFQKCFAYYLVQFSWEIPLLMRIFVAIP